MSNRPGYVIRDQYACYFVTFTIVGWIDVFSRKACKDIIMDALIYCRKHKGLNIHAFVIMESHLHLVLSAQPSSKGLSAIIRDFKKYTAKQIIEWASTSMHESRRDWMLLVFRHFGKRNKRNAKYQVWKQDNRPKELFYPKFTAQKVNYIHQNPVAAGIVDAAEDYLHSSARNYVGRDDFLFEVELLDF